MIGRSCCMIGRSCCMIVLFCVLWWIFTHSLTSCFPLCDRPFLRTICFLSHFCGPTSLPIFRQPYDQTFRCVCVHQLFPTFRRDFICKCHNLHHVIWMSSPLNSQIFWIFLSVLSFLSYFFCSCFRISFSTFWLSCLCLIHILLNFPLIFHPSNLLILFHKIYVSIPVLIRFFQINR